MVIFDCVFDAQTVAGSSTMMSDDLGPRMVALMSLTMDCHETLTNVRQHLSCLMTMGRSAIDCAICCRTSKRVNEE